MTERIDAFSHVTTQELTERLRAVTPSLEGYSPPRLLLLEHLDDRIDNLDELGVDRQVITIAEQRAWLGHEPGDMTDLVRFANDEVRRYADEYPDRFIPVGTIPYPTESYVDEVERCVDDLDMVGIQVFSNINGRFLDDETFYPFYRTVDELDIPVWIHPQDYEWHDYDDAEYWLYTMLGWPFETGIAIGRLVFSGVLDEFENLRFITHHLGGVIPYLEERLYSWVATRREAPPGRLSGQEQIEALSNPIETYFDRIYADTAVSSQAREPTLRCGYEFFGADNVLFAADAAYGPGDGFGWMRNTIPTIEAMDLPASAKRKIFSENIRRLIS